MSNDFVVDVTESNFDYDVLEYSQNVPVLVDFWAEWCRPCKVLSPMLEKLAEEGRGTFRLAKVDTDLNKNLSIRYGIRTIPTIKAFLKGQVTAEFSGVQPEPKLREFIRTLAPSPADLLVEKGFSLLKEHDWKMAEIVFNEGLLQDKNSSRGMLGLLMSYAAQGNSADAKEILRTFPASPEYKSAEILKPLIESYTLVDYAELNSDDELEAAFWNNVRLARRGNIQAAIDGLLDILRINKHYKKDLARQVILALLLILGDEDPDARQYRSELATILF
jgi:putative thioredoxin